jgi:aminoglycoside phosphotransferase (APT) family kinase protein
VELAEQGGLDAEDLLAARLRRRFGHLASRAGLADDLPAEATLRPLLRWPEAGRSLLHMDLRAANLLCRDGRVSAVIDWANAVVGDPALEMARIAEYGEWGADFRRGYEEVASPVEPPEPVETLYRLDTAVMLANVFLSERPDLARRQIERVRELLDRLRRVGS